MLGAGQSSYLQLYVSEQLIWVELGNCSEKISSTKGTLTLNTKEQKQVLVWNRN